MNVGYDLEHKFVQNQHFSYIPDYFDAGSKIAGLVFLIFFLFFWK